MSLINKPLRRTLPNDDILAEYDGGASMSSLAKKHECGTNTIKRILIAGGREIRKAKGGRPKKKIIDHEEIAAKIEANRKLLGAFKDPPEEVIKEIKRKIGW